MVTIGPDPILLHIMKHYSSFGFCRFVLCMGYKSEIIRDYFLNFYARNSDVTIELKSNSLEVHNVDHSCDWRVTLAYTGEPTMTGGRIARAVARYLGDAEHYAITYGDGLTDADLGAGLDYHLSHGKIGTVLGVNPPSRFGEFRMDGRMRASRTTMPLSVSRTTCRVVPSSRLKTPETARLLCRLISKWGS
jgi:glucose-1-phosphate cytidylyltransferase